MPVDYGLTTYTAFDLFAWYEQGELELSPKFQRRPVWTTAARSYFVDSILREFPVPPLHIRLIGPGQRSTRREIIDGQQRLRALFDFIGGRFALSRALQSEWAGRSLDELPAEVRDRLFYYKFSVYQYQGLSDPEVLEIFARLNTYSEGLSRQELRNGKYFGQFKTAVYESSYRHLEFWRTHKILSERAIARMGEAELTSELFALELDGLQDKKTSLDEFYRNLDESWGDEPARWPSSKAQLNSPDRPQNWLSRDEAVFRFEHVLANISDAVGELLPATVFRRPVLFYTLFGAVYHRMYGMPRERDLQSPLVELSSQAARRLWYAMEALDELVASKPRPESVPPVDRIFLGAMAGQTDNLAPRRTRLHELWRRADLSVA
ncbi:DUF262 domain-containing protein [Pimelobacter simplex]|uniref:GmrSD restriction endonucleases N-terminal domain-containing protein n=1 Tax=Nocardioides simplex TaxID=2045 RepID=A0A0J9YH58_NOCSI|nr:DUF262 domain-containing protein [Pimelobacter simplex]AIY17859.1 hypothetical protein KR76_15750 [Pimelobacter simplex]MCG8152769.1 DUF262 domain-containing protein [Pimelobacter simplex]GEB16859.1 hypothetical protein NSI01_51740 [Pimelobacter simplex]SFM73687.1 Protein of unknown function DUF262 [Pimelobacter simplex]